VTLVAISASYGAGGGRIASALAERLDVPFLGRAIPFAVAERLAVPYELATAYDEQVCASRLEQLLRGFLNSDVGGVVPLPADTVTPADFYRATREVLMRQAATGEGVILGRGAVAALRRDPSVLRVRLDGPPDARVRRVMSLEGVDEETAKRAMRRLDSAHRAYLKHFYGASLDDPSLYHLMIDSTALNIDGCIDLIEQAAEILDRDLLLGRP
jgi:Cytidylate kinase-like family